MSNNHITKKNKTVSDRTPQNSKNGEWNGDRGNSDIVFEQNAKPNNNNYGNLKDQTFSEMGKDLGDENPSVKFSNNYPIFDRDGGTDNKKTS